MLDLFEIPYRMLPMSSLIMALVLGVIHMAALRCVRTFRLHLPTGRACFLSRPTRSFFGALGVILLMSGSLWIATGDLAADDPDLSPRGEAAADSHSAIVQPDDNRAPFMFPSPISAKLAKEIPEGKADLAAIETQVRKVVENMVATTVCVQIGDTQGSGVIVSADGYVLTAAHVVGAPGRAIRVILSDGRRVNGTSLGLNKFADVGLVKISNAETYPFAKLSDLQEVSLGHWCIALGHPGGYEPGRPPVVRLGRIVNTRKAIYQTDCPLVGGDSGGPLFDLDGHVIAVHSRIGASTTLNLHIPINLITEHWAQFAASDLIDPRQVNRKALLGVNGKDHEQGAELTAVFPKWPADLAGLQPGDVVTQFEGEPVSGFEDLRNRILDKAPGDNVLIGILRNGESIEANAILIGQP